MKILITISIISMLRVCVAKWPFGPEAEAEYAATSVDLPTMSAMISGASTMVSCPSSEPVAATLAETAIAVPPVVTAETMCVGETSPQPPPVPDGETHMCAYNISSCSYTNVTMIYRLENTQDEYFAAAEFCQARGPGVHCYEASTDTTNSTTKCMPNVMISCPEQVFLRCRDGFFCMAGPGIGGNGSQCRALIEHVPKTAWNYGTPAMVFSEGMVKGYKVVAKGGTKTIWTPDRCMGPYPLPLERCISKAQELMEACPMTGTTPQDGIATSMTKVVYFSASPIPLETALPSSMRKLPRATKVEVEYGL